MRGFDPYFTLQKLQVFCTVADLNSVTRAADKLCVAQPVVTAHIRGLEAKLGVTLTKRVGRNIALTEAGERVYRWANETITRTHEIERELSDMEAGGTGHTVIAASMTAGSYLLPSLISNFYANHRDGFVTVQIGGPGVAIDAVRTGACDFAVVMLAPSQNLDRLKTYTLREDPLLLVSAPNSSLIGDSADATVIAEVPFISAPTNLVRRELEDNALRKHNITDRHVVLEFGHPEALKRAVRQDLGVCFMIESSAKEDIERGDLRVVQTPGLKLAMPLFLVHRQDKELSPFQTALMEYLLATVGTGDDQLPSGMSSYRKQPNRVSENT